MKSTALVKIHTAICGLANMSHIVGDILSNVKASYIQHSDTQTEKTFFKHLVPLISIMTTTFNH